MKRLLNLFLLLIFLSSSSTMLLASRSASAVSASEWKAGRIIDDSKFTELDMSVNDIQAFLNNKVSNCDTWGTQPAGEYGRSDLTHAQYAASRGWPGPPYVCLRNYNEVPKTIPGSGVPVNSYDNGGNPPANSISAAQMIYNAAQQYKISPKVLLVKLDTESAGPLTRDTWPLRTQYTYAMGAHCPDSGPGGSANCDPNYAGFSIQISEAAELLRWYLDGMTQSWWQYKRPFQSNYILWNVEPRGCGGADVFLETMGSAALYTYTPYQPNQAALSNMYGTGDGCSAYGNRNFWRVYNDWFGTTLTGVAPLPVTSVTLNTTEATVGQTVTATYKITNPFNFSLSLPSVGVNNRLGDTVLDFGIEQNISLAANETKTFIANFTPSAPGAYRMQGVYNYYTGWYGGSYSWLNVHMPSLSVTSAPSISPQYPLINTSYSTSFTIKNTGGLTAYLTNLMQANMDGATPRGYKAVTLSLPPGQSYTYTDTRTLTNTSAQTTWVAYQLGSGWYRIGDNMQYRSYATAANLELIAPITVSPVYPVINASTTAKFKVKNTGDQPIWLSNLGLGVQRTSDGQRFDYASQIAGIPGLILGGQEYEFKSSRVFLTKDNYTVFLTGSYNGVDFTADLVNSSSIPKSIDMEVYSSPAKLEVTQPIQSQQSSGPLSHIVDLQYSVKNTGDAPTGNIYLAFYCRQNSTIYCDIPMSATTLDSGQSKIITRSLAYFSPGTYVFKPLKYMDGLWQDFDSGTVVNIANNVPNRATFSTTLSVDQNDVVVGTLIHATYTIKNNSAYDLQLPVYAVAARLNKAFYDFGLQNWFYIRAGETKTFTSTFTPAKTGTYTLFPVLRTANDSWYGYQEMSLVVR